MLRMGRAEWAMLLALSVLWGGSFFFIGVAVRELPTFTLVALRVGLAAVALWAFVGFSGRRVPHEARVWAAFLGMGLLNNVVPFSLIVWGQLSIASGLASILNATTPLWTVLVAGLLLPDEPLSGRKLGGVVVGLLGVALMIGLDALGGLGAHVLAQLAVLAGALSYAFAGVFGRRFRYMGVDPIVTAAGQVTAAALVLAPVALLVEQPWTLMLSLAVTWGAVVGLALLSTAVAYVLYFLILERAGATNLLLVTFLIPVSAILLGAAVLGERLSWTHGLGMLLISAGLAAIDGRLLRGWVQTRTVRDP